MLMKERKAVGCEQKGYVDMEEYMFISALMKFKTVLVPSSHGRYDHLSPKDACNVISKWYLCF